MRPGDLLEQRYRLVRVLGRGRSGSVWCARNELIDRAVAVKILHRSLASDPERLQRFFQEARACGRVRHPSVVEVLDLGQGDEGILFLVMELLEGETMASLLGRKGRLSVDEALALVIPLAHGLAAAHAHGILHRDLKPANIYLHKTPTGGLQPKILDFGISKIIGNDVTATGVVLGTPSYMSPEQARGVPDLDPRTDVWSLGVILYEALTGRLPFIAKEYRSLVDEIIDRKHLTVDQLVPEIPADVARVVDEVLEKSRDRRLPTAAQMAQRLTTILRSRGKGELLRDPDDEFSEGAPTLARDRDKMGFPAPSNIDDTVGDHAPLAVAKPGRPTPAVPDTTRPGVGGLARTQLGVQPSAATLALAALTAGSKRNDGTAPRPAAGAPARPPRTKDDLDATRPRIRAEAPPEGTPEETRPDPVPLTRRASGPNPEPAREGMTTQSWEVAAAQAASGRAEVILGRSASSPIQVNQDWDTTVADVAAGDITEKGPLPKAAPPPVLSDPPPSREQIAIASNRALKRSPATQTADERPISRRSIPPSSDRKATPIGSIPGFNAPPPRDDNPLSVTPATPALTSRPHTRPPPSTPPPPRAAPSNPPPAAGRAPEHGIASKRPPRPPPRSMPPPGNAFSGATLRPTPGMRPTPVMLAEPLLSADLYALGDERIVEQPFELTRSDPKSDTNGHGPPVVISSETNPNIETDKRRLGPSLVPLMVAAVAVLFFFGIVVGTIAASRRGDAHYVRRFAAANAVLAEWHDHSEKIARAELEKQIEAPAPQKAPEPEPTPSAAPTPTHVAPTPTPHPVATPKPQPKPATTSKPTSTTKPQPKPATTTDPKKKGNGEWWQKKF